MTKTPASSRPAGRTGTRSFGDKGSAPKPLGTRPPRINWSLISLRLIVLVSVLLVACQPLLLGWADAHPPIPAVARPAAVQQHPVPLVPTRPGGATPTPPGQQLTATLAQATGGAAQVVH